MFHFLVRPAFFSVDFVYIYVTVFFLVNEFRLVSQQLFVVVLKMESFVSVESN